MARLRLRLSLHRCLRAIRIRWHKRRRCGDLNAAAHKLSSQFSPQKTLDPSREMKDFSKAEASRDEMRMNSAAAQAAAAEIPSKNRRRTIFSSSSSGFLLGCNPCAGGSAGSVLEHHKMKISTKNSWERQKSWRTVTQVDEKFVCKNVVLKKRQAEHSSEGSTSPKFRFSTSSSSSAADGLVSKCRLSTSSSSADCSSSRYRLSTSSGEAGHWDSGRFAWDREASFASGDEGEDFELMDRLESSSKDAFSQNPSNSMVDSWLQQEKIFPSPDFSSDDDHDELAISSSALQQIPSRGICSSSSNSGDSDAAAEGAAIPAKFSIDRDDESCEIEGIAGSQQMPKMGKAVAKVSQDPYEDYMQSVIEMMAAYDLRDRVQLHNLRQAYLALNPQQLHVTILQVFDDVIKYSYV